MNRRKLLLPVPVFFLVCLASLAALAQQPNTNITESPKVITAAAPDYPILVALSLSGGDVPVEVKIDRSGKVSSASADVGNPLLRKAAVETAYRWRFEPASADVRTVRLLFSFQLGDDYEPGGQHVATVFLPPYKVEITYKLPPHIDY
jgi:TonB family protein